MSTSTTTAPNTLLSRLMPTEVSGWVRAMAWASMLANALLIVTGGAVRLTGSGLGCPTWPRCTSESWTNTPEMGIHGYIEFGNRTLTFVLAAIAVLTFMAVWNLRRRHPGWFAIALGLALGIILQAVVGGITVRTGLNPWIVGIHFVLSAVLISMAAVLVNRTRRVSLPHVARDEAPGGIIGGDRRVARTLALVIGVCSALTIYFGTLVTGTGPHSGDSGEVARHTFNAYVIARVHAAPVYLLVVTAVALVYLAYARRWPAAIRRISLILAVLIAAQAAVGYYQWFNGVPELAVAAHLAGAAALTAVVTMVVEKVYVVTSDPQPGLTALIAEATGRVRRA